MLFLCNLSRVFKRVFTIVIGGDNVTVGQKIETETVDSESHTNSVNNGKIEHANKQIMDSAVREKRPQIISQYLTFDPSSQMSHDKIFKQTQVNYNLVSAAEQSENKHSEILSNEIPALNLSFQGNIDTIMNHLQYNKEKYQF